MGDKFFTLRAVALHNNCPECYSRDGLQLTFKQRFIENYFYKAISNETTHSLFCDVCKTVIFPVRWDDDIDRVFEYQQRASSPKPKSFKLKPTFWILLGLFVTLAIVIVAIVVGVF